MPEDEADLPSTSKQVQPSEIIGKSNEDDDYMGYRFSTEIKQEPEEGSDLHCYEEMERERSSSGSRNSGSGSNGRTGFSSIVAELMITHLRSGINQYACYAQVEADIVGKFSQFARPALRERIRSSWSRCKCLARSKEASGTKMSERDLRILEALRQAAMNQDLAGPENISTSKCVVSAAISFYLLNRDTSEELDEDIAAFKAWKFIEDYVEKRHPQHKWNLWTIFKDLVFLAEGKVERGEKLNKGEEAVITLLSVHPGLAKPSAGILPLTSLCGLSERADSEERPTTSSTTPSSTNNSAQAVIEIDSDDDISQKSPEVRRRFIRLVKNPTKLVFGPSKYPFKRRIEQNTTTNITHDAQPKEVAPSPFKAIRVVRMPANCEASAPSTSFELEIDSNIGIYNGNKHGKKAIVLSKANAQKRGGVRFPKMVPATSTTSGNLLTTTTVPSDPGRPPNKTLPLPQWFNVVDYCRRTKQIFSFDGDTIIFSDPAAPGYEIRLPLDRVASGLEI